jgi:hypothetical protein
MQLRDVSGFMEVGLSKFHFHRLCTTLPQRKWSDAKRVPPGGGKHPQVFEAVLNFHYKTHVFATIRAQSAFEQERHRLSQSACDRGRALGVIFSDLHERNRKAPVRFCEGEVKGEALAPFRKRLENSRRSGSRHVGNQNGNGELAPQ